MPISAFVFVNNLRVTFRTELASMIVEEMSIQEVTNIGLSKESRQLTPSTHAVNSQHNLKAVVTCRMLT